MLRSPRELNPSGYLGTEGLNNIVAIFKQIFDINSAVLNKCKYKAPDRDQTKEIVLNQQDPKGCIVDGTILNLLQNGEASDEPK